VRRMAILAESGDLRVSLKWGGVLPKELPSGFCHALACLPWGCGRGRVFDPCRVIFHSYGQGLLSISSA